MADSEYFEVMPDDPMEYLKFRFPDMPQHMLEKSIEDNTVDGALNLESSVLSLIKFGADGKAFLRRRKATVWKRGSAHGATFSKNKVGVDDNDMWDGEVDDGGDSGTTEEHPPTSIFNSMLSALDGVTSQSALHGGAASLFDFSSNPASPNPVSNEYLDVEASTGQGDLGKEHRLTKMSMLLPDVDEASIAAALASNDDDGQKAFIDLLSKAGTNNEYTDVESAAKAVVASAVPSAIKHSRRWQDRQDVIDGGFAASLDNKAIKRQEAIAELGSSEEAYLKDVTVLLDTLLKPMHQASIAGNPIDESIAHSQTRSMLESVELLVSHGRAFHADIQARQSESVVVESISDIVLKWTDSLRLAFSGYCSTSFFFQTLFSNMTPAMKALCKKFKADQSSRSLPPDAFVLVPIQRVARYPLLLQAIADRTEDDHADAEDIMRAFGKMKEIAQMCDALLRSLDDHATLEKLQQQLDFSRIENPQDIRANQASQGFVDRALLKRGRLQMVSLQIDKKSHKVSKSQRLEFMLFTDMLVYAKPVKGERRYVVYKQMHRSLVEASIYEAPGKYSAPSKKAPPLFLIELTLYSGSTPTKCVVNCKSASERERWMEALSPAPKDNEYELWDCPTGRVILPYEATQSDELTLRQGDIINILSKGDESGMYKGVIVGSLLVTNRKASGWFPVRCIKEIATVHQEARMRKANYKFRQLSGNV